MSMTVKKLIAELEKIDNKFLEVEVYSLDHRLNYVQVDYVKKVDRKVLIFGSKRM